MNNYDHLFEDTYFFFDIETISIYENYHDLDERSLNIWEKMSDKQHRIKDYLKMGISQDIIFPKLASLYNEFNKIVSICYGTFVPGTEERNIEGLSLFKDGSTEKDIIQKFGQVVQSYPNAIMCGYNILGFDIPQIIKKMVKYNIPLPKSFQIFGKKRWAMKGIADLSEIWRCDTNDYTSLEGVMNFLSLPSSKDELSGDRVTSLFYENPEENIHLIEKYCKKDVEATMALFLYLKNSNVF